MACMAWLGGLGCVSLRMTREAEMPVGDSNPLAEAAYGLLLEQHTAEKTLLDGLDTRAMVAATLEQPAFAQARIQRIGHLRAWPENKIETEWENEARRLEGVTEFFIGMQSASPKHNDLDMRSSIWQLSLQVGNEVYFPNSIRRVGRSTMDMRGLYPYMGLSWVGYRVQFPIALTPPFRVGLVLSSVLGKAEFFYSTLEGPMRASHY